MIIRTKKDLIDEISIGGTFDFKPANKLRALEKVLHNVKLSAESLQEVFEIFFGALLYCRTNDFKVQQILNSYGPNADKKIKPK